MKFDLISDFHVEFNVMYSETKGWKQNRGLPEFYAWNIDKKSDILVVAGDISNDTFISIAVIEEASKYYEQVVFVDGNHDHYGGSDNPFEQNYTNNMAYYRKVEKLNDNITFLDGGENAVILNKTLFVGACGWYDFKMTFGMHPRAMREQWKRHSNDPVCIRFGKKNRPEKLAVRQAEAIRDWVDEVQDNDEVEDIVVVTHTIPHQEGLIKDPSHEWYPLNGAYANSEMHKVWEADKNEKIKTWVFGHTHFQYDFMHRHVRFVTNPRGYRSERRKKGGFKGLKQIDTQEPIVESAFGKIERE